MSKRTTYLLLLSLLLLSCNSSGSKKDYIYHQEQGEIFHTGFHIKYAYSRSLRQEIMAELDRFDRSLNPFRDDAIITRVNRNELVETDSFFRNCFNRAQEIALKTNGKFDITVSPLINAWGFGFANMESVTPEIIDSLKQFVGYDKIMIDAEGKIVKSDPRVTLNTSAIAKGYACDVVGDMLERHGIDNYMVEIGGEITARGVNDKGECWRIGVDKPIDDSTGMQHELQTILSLCDKALATSGNYRNFYIRDGKKYAHTIDPLSGYPSQLDILGATVIADDCMTADAYATAFMAMGIEQSQKVAATIPGLHYLFIYEVDNGMFGTIQSDGFEQFIAD